MLLYAGNLSERELPRLRLIRWLGVFFLVTVAGGVLGVLAPHFEFTSAVEMLLPERWSNKGFIQSLVHPHAAQIHEVLGYESPRPAAPFNYTNTWGYVLSLTLVWFVVGWWVYGGATRRLLTPLLLAVAVVLVVISLNRGTWLALVLIGAYIMVRLIAWGRLWALGVMCAALAVGTIVFVVTPLHVLVAERLAHPHSNNRRIFTIVRTFEASTHSPVLGFGTTRTARGSAQSIAIGESASCPRCGNPTLGSNGQLWLLLISQGYTGVLLYVGFFTYLAARYWRDRTPLGVTGTLVLLLSLYYMLVYNAIVTPLSLTMLSLALLWRNDIERKNQQRISAMQGAVARARARQRPAGETP